MSESAPGPRRETQNGRHGGPFDGARSSPAEEVLGHAVGGPDSPPVTPMILDATSELFGDPPEGLRPDPVHASPQVASTGRGREGVSSTRKAGGLSLSGRTTSDTAQELLSQAQAHAESLTARTHADAQELLSRARSHAELLRVQAEAARAEGECLQGEVAALRTAIRDEAQAASSRAESMLAQAQAAAEELRSAMEAEAAAARAEVERLRTEAASLRRLLQAELGAGLADAQRMRAEVERLWTETDKFRADLHLVSARAGAAAGVEQLGGHTNIREEGHGRPPEPEPSPPPAAVTPPPVERPTVETMVASHHDPADREHPGLPDEDYLRRIVTVEVQRLLSEMHGRHADEPPEQPVPGAVGKAEAEPPGDPPEGGVAGGDAAASQPLIGSGGWQTTARVAAAVPAGRPAGDQAMPPPPPPTRERHRRFGRR